MSASHPLVTIDDLAITHLVEYCHAQHLNRLIMVADQNTYAAQGKAVEAALREAEFDLKKVVFTSREVVADAAHVLDVLVEAGREDRTYIAVGSGTLTDITRFSSHRTKSSFISVPTAPSVDGFASIGAPLIIHGVKITVLCQAPIAIFADINTLAHAPRAMIAAGFADMLGKYTSIADWRIGRLLWNEPYEESISVRTLAAVDQCADNAAAIGKGSPAAVRTLMDALIESGFCMLDFGTSRPASGAEHHLSHYWEMKLLTEGRPAILHGAKVGVATVLIAGIYEQIRSLSREQVADLLEAASLPSRQAQVAQIRAAYGAEADEVIAGQAGFLNLSPADFDVLKRKILDNWGEIQAIAEHVPAPETIADLLRTVGGPTTVNELNLTEGEKALAMANGHYLRDRFTSRKLVQYLAID